MMRLSQPNGAPQGISGGKDHQKHLDISVTAIRFNLLRITRIHTESELNMLLWPLITSQHNLTCVRSTNMRLYTHVPSSGRRASTGSADGWTTWMAGGTETERRHAAGPAPKSATHRHTAMRQLPCDPVFRHTQKQCAHKQENAWLLGQRERPPVQSKNPLGQS